MRIIAGRAKGRSLLCLPGDAIRPSPERMRAALFNMLAPDLPGMTVLDLFAGTGSLGLEALSRGADHCVFVESHPAALAVLQRNVSSLGFTHGATLIHHDVFHVPGRLERLGRTYSCIFAAPPYALLENTRTAQPLLAVLADTAERFGNPDLTVNLQHSPRSFLSEAVGRLLRFDHRRYGNAELSRYRSSPVCSETPSP
jgi:16S rRNA (guanine966-N2)-methyltransferase